MKKLAWLVLFTTIISCSSDRPAEVVHNGEKFYGNSPKHGGAKSRHSILLDDDPNVPSFDTGVVEGEPDLGLAKITTKNTMQYEPLKKIQPMRDDEFSLVKPLEPQDKKVTLVKPSDANYIWPVKGKIVAKFGSKMGDKTNDGINIAATAGEPVKAAADGTIIYIGNALKVYGNLLIIRHKDGILSAYGHLDNITHAKGDNVMQGDSIGVVGTSGDVSSPQLHFAVRKDKKPIDPLPFLPIED